MAQGLPVALEKDLPKHGEIVAGRYVVAELLGSGGMSAVFKVSHQLTKKLFAMKWMLPSLRSEPDAVARFVREAQVASRVDHTNVVEVYDCGQQGDSFFMVMEFMQGESLAGRLAKGPLTAAQACCVVAPAARGVAAAHAAGVIHRDLKPHNIFLARESSGQIVPKVLDFGISKLTQLYGELGEAITREGDIIGTPHYMAPEQIRAEPIDERVDVYGLGVILYESLTGELPFPGSSYSDLVFRIMTETPKPITLRAPETPRALIDLVNRAMARNRAERFETVSEFADALESLGKQLGEGSALGTTPTLPAHATPALPNTPLSSEAKRTADSVAKSSSVLRTWTMAAVVSTCVLVGVGLTLRGVLMSNASPPAPPAAAATDPSAISAPPMAAEAKSPAAPAEAKPATASVAAPAAPPSSQTGAAGAPAPDAALPNHPSPPETKKRRAVSPRPKPPPPVAAAPEPAPQPPETPKPSSTRRTRELGRDDF